ncbi:MAG TPA: prolyl oligopeptidase family serine peptidase [Candidatus Binatia bacterium]|nr:prolyl oligopeptidase family serine peptidase [Candidatus Binatia bacterium]
MKKLSLVLIWALAVQGFATETATGETLPFHGEYRLASGGWVSFTRMGVIDELAKPLFIDWESGRYGPVMAAGSDRFVSPPFAKADSPWQTELQFLRDAAGRVTGLAIREKDGQSRTAERADPWIDREVTFSSAGVSLAATLRLPPGQGPLPAVVLVHGSGPGTRSQLVVMSAFFARLGMAVLWYDKRGCGGSGGDWKKVDLEALAADAIAGAQWLRSRPEIDRRRIGVWGISQGGWITPLAGSLDPELAFVINSSGPGTSLRRQDTYMMANVLRAAKIKEDDIALFLAMLGALYDYGRGLAPAEALDKLSAQVRLRPELKDMAMPPASELTPDAMYAKQVIGDPAWFYHLDPDRDALAPYRTLRCPLLVTYGKLDMTVPVEESVRVIEETLRAAAHTDFSVQVLATAGHGFAMMKEGEPPAPVQPGHLSREFFSTIENWLRQRGFCGGQKK